MFNIGIDNVASSLLSIVVLVKFEDIWLGINKCQKRMSFLEHTGGIIIGASLHTEYITTVFLMEMHYILLVWSCSRAWMHASTHFGSNLASLSACSLIGFWAGLNWLVLIYCERKTLLAGWFGLAETNKRTDRLIKSILPSSE